MKIVELPIIQSSQAAATVQKQLTTLYNTQVVGKF